MKTSSQIYFSTLACVSFLFSACLSSRTDGGLLLPQVGFELDRNDLTKMGGINWMNGVFEKDKVLKQRLLVFLHSYSVGTAIWKNIEKSPIRRACQDVRNIFGKTKYDFVSDVDCLDLDLSILRTEIRAEDCPRISAYAPLGSKCETCGKKSDCVRMCLDGIGYFREIAGNEHGTDFPSEWQSSTQPQIDLLCATNGTTGAILPIDPSNATAESVSLKDCILYCDTVVLNRTRCTSTSKPLTGEENVNAPEAVRVLQALAPISYFLTSDGYQYTQWLRHYWEAALEIDVELSKFLELNASTLPPRRLRAFQQMMGGRLHYSAGTARENWMKLVRFQSAYQALLHTIESTCGPSSVSRPSSISTPGTPVNSQP